MKKKVEGYNIVLEGCDGVGKTTVAAIMCREGDMHLAIHQNAPKSKKEAENYYRTGIKLINRMDYIILDRFTLSERVYAPIFRNYIAEYLDELEKTILPHNYLFLLHATSDILEKRWDGKMITKAQIPLIIRDYRIAFQLCNYSKKYILSVVNRKPHEVVEIILNTIKLDRDGEL